MIQNPAYTKISILLPNQETEIKENLTYRLTADKNVIKLTIPKRGAEKTLGNGSQNINAYIHLEKRFDRTL